MKKFFKQSIWTILGVLFLFLVWEIASRVYGSGLILPGPAPVIKKFIGLILTKRFFISLLWSFLRVFGGIVFAVPLGIAAGIAAGLDKRAHAFLKPLFSVISATPVISIILILFLILGSGRTPALTAFLIAFPVISANMIEGVKSADVKLKELFVSFKMTRGELLKYFYIPTLAPFIFGGIQSSLSLCWKAVVAAEVIVQPLRSLGTGMQNARANLEIPELFAWTCATVIAAALSQAALSFFINRFSPFRQKAA